MAYLLVLEFMNEKDAEEYLSHEQLVGLFKRPTLFCDGMCVKAGYTRGQKWGWWVCSSCRKPTRLWGNSVQAVVSQGVNLLQQDQIIPESDGQRLVILTAGGVPKAGVDIEQSKENL